MHRVALALVVALLVVGCGTTTPSSSPSPLAIVPPSAAAASPSPSSTAAPTATPRPTATPVPTASPSPTPAPTPVPWLGYTSKRFHYKIKYPPTWVVTPGSAKLSDQFDGFTYPYVFVSRDVVSRGATASVSLTTTRQIAYYKSHYKGKVLVNKAVRVGGWSGRLLIFSGTDNGVKLLYQQVNVARGRVGYFIEMESYLENAKADKVLFKKVYSTFKPT